MSRPVPRFVHWNGAIIPANEARVSVFDTGFLYGDGIYETMRAYAGCPFALSRHLNRLHRNAVRTDLRLPSDAALETAVRDALEANEMLEAIVRVTITRGALARRLDLSSSGAPSVLVTCDPVDPDADEEIRRGIVVVYSRYRRLSEHPLAGVKSTNYQVSLFARNEAREARAREVLVANETGEIVEGAAANVFLVEDGRLVTPPVGSGILAGITREIVLELAASRGLPAIEETLTRERVAGAGELFLSGTTIRIAPVVRVEDDPVGDGLPGPITLRLLDDYLDLVRRDTGGVVPDQDGA
jgi:branched-chain amino acid aminotransferase